MDDVGAATMAHKSAHTQYKETRSILDDLFFHAEQPSAIAEPIPRIDLWPAQDPGDEPEKWTSLMRDGGNRESRSSRRDSDEEKRRRSSKRDSNILEQDEYSERGKSKDRSNLTQGEEHTAQNEVEAWPTSATKKGKKGKKSLSRNSQLVDLFGPEEKEAIQESIPLRAMSFGKINFWSMKTTKQ